tara:strand:+ start:2182 stop:2952 length:771 start_codon:yes stop_codon:yes gene_type:complete
MALTKISRGLLNTGVSDSSDATAITITSGEDVGIGTTSPGEKLTISSAADTISKVITTSSSSSGQQQIHNSDSNGASIISYSGSASGTLFGVNRAAKSFITSNLETVIGTTSNHFLGFATNSTERMRISSTGDLKFNSGFGSVGTAYGVRAWVRFRGDTSGTGDRQVDGSGNVSSVGYIGTGRYQMNFSNSMPDVHFAVAASGVGVTNHNPMSASIDSGYSANVGYVDLAYGPSGGANSVSIGTNSGAMYNAIVVR